MTRKRALIAAAGFALCLLIPLVVDDDYSFQILFRVVLFAGLGLAWNLVGGYAGQLSLGHAAFFGLGGYGFTIIHDELHLPLLASLALTLVVVAIAAALIGLVAFRLRGPYFALATIAFAEVLHQTVKNLHDLTGGEVGKAPPMIFENHRSQWFYACAVLLTAFAFALTAWIARSRFGFALQAIREDEDTAMACGINTTRTKVYAFMISAAITAVGGVLHASLFMWMTPDQMLEVGLSNEIAIVAMLGGAGTLLGPLIGAGLLETASELFKNLFHEAHLIIYGVLIVLVVLFLPEGIVGALGKQLRARRAAR